MILILILTSCSYRTVTHSHSWCGPNMWRHCGRCTGVNFLSALVCCDFSLDFLGALESENADARSGRHDNQQARACIEIAIVSTSKMNTMISNQKKAKQKARTFFSTKLRRCLAVNQKCARRKILVLASTLYVHSCFRHIYRFCLYPWSISYNRFYFFCLNHSLRLGDLSQGSRISIGSQQLNPPPVCRNSASPRSLVISSQIF